MAKRNKGKHRAPASGPGSGVSGTVQQEVESGNVSGGLAPEDEAWPEAEAEESFQAAEKASVEEFQDAFGGGLAGAFEAAPQTSPPTPSETLSPDGSGNEAPEPLSFNLEDEAWSAEEDAEPEAGMGAGSTLVPETADPEAITDTTAPVETFVATGGLPQGDERVELTLEPEGALDSDLSNTGDTLAAAMDAAASGGRKRKTKRPKTAPENSGASPAGATPTQDDVAHARAEAATLDAADTEQSDTSTAADVEAEPLPDNVRDLFGASSDEISPELASQQEGLESEPFEDELPLAEGLERLEGARLESVVESLLFASDKLLSMTDMRRLTGVRDSRKLQKALDDIKDRRLESGIILVEAAGSFRFQTHPANADWVGRMVQGKPVRLSRAMMETLAIVAYKQPITRPEVDDIRGVDCGPVLKTLLDRNLVRVIGKKEDVGRPLLYGTTPDFLKTFNLSDLTELPTLREFHELGAEESQKMKQKFGEEPAPERASAEGPQSDAAGEPQPQLQADAPEKRIDGLKGDRPSAFSNNTVADVPDDESLIEELERATEAATRALEAGKGDPNAPAS